MHNAGAAGARDCLLDAIRTLVYACLLITCLLHLDYADYYFSPQLAQVHMISCGAVHSSIFYRDYWSYREYVPH